MQIKEMTGTQVMKAWREAQDVARAQRVFMDAVKSTYKPIAAANGGKAVLFVDEAGIAHGFEVSPERGRLSATELDKVLAELGLDAEQIAFVKERAKGKPGTNFSSF
jgi:hypothetical protein